MAVHTSPRELDMYGVKISMKEAEKTCGGQYELFDTSMVLLPSLGCWKINYHIWNIFIVQSVYWIAGKREPSRLELAVFSTISEVEVWRHTLFNVFAYTVEVATMPLLCPHVSYHLASEERKGGVDLFHSTCWNFQIGSVEFDDELYS